MGFHFSLASVLRVRGVVEGQEERLLQQILCEIAQTTEKVAEIEVQIEELNALREASVSKPTAGYLLHASYGEVKALKQFKKEQEEKLVKLEELRLRQIKVWEAARRNREMLTDMRESQKSLYDVEILRSEQRKLDDNYIARRGRVGKRQEIA
jgi:flagellar export protein FliJ